MRKVFFAFALALSCSAQAAIIGFTGDYNPANWTQSPGTGSVNSFTATDLSITSGDNYTETQIESLSDTDVGIAIPAGGPVRISFKWLYTTEDADQTSFWDPFGIKTLLVGDSPPPLFTELTDPFGGAEQSGSYFVVLNPGDYFAFSQRTLDNRGGPATTRISDFRVDPFGVPEPGTLALFAVALAGGLAARRRT